MARPKNSVFSRKEKTTQRSIPITDSVWDSIKLLRERVEKVAPDNTVDIGEVCDEALREFVAQGNAELDEVERRSGSNVGQAA